MVPENSTQRILLKDKFTEDLTKSKWKLKIQPKFSAKTQHYRRLYKN